jgi:predicted DCC family thiol-disulfide oxidoreductase YuxK
MKQLASRWQALASLLQLLPKSLRDAVYNAVARRRYRIFGRTEACMLPPDQGRNRFLDL